MLSNVLKQSYLEDYAQQEKQLQGKKKEA